MEIARIMENKEIGKIYGLVGNTKVTANNINYSLVTEFKFSGKVSSFLNNQKASNALKMVMLNDSYLEKNVDELSEAETKKIILANALIENKPYLVLDYFEKGLTHKEKENYKRLFKKLSVDYNKTIIIYTNDITFLWDIAHEIIYIDETENINTITKKEYFKLSRIVDKPEIIKFIDLMHDKGIQVEDYKDVLDLLKAIYRIKGE